MPKSTPMPMNSTAKAMEMRFSAPTSHSPTAAVMSSPTSVQANTARISRAECSAIHSRRRTAATVMMLFSAKPSLTVPNSWSLSGIGPVRRTRTPFSGVRCRSLMAFSTTSVAASPGSSRP